MALQTVGWLQNAGAVHTAAQLRMYLASLQAGNAVSATSLRARGGVHPSFGTELVVTQTASPSMGVLVESGIASIPGTQSSTQGNYFVVNDAQVTLSVTAAHASLPRIDLVVINIRDAFYSGVNNDVQLQVIAGTPASSPVAPAVPDNAFILAQVAVGAGVASITDANITDTRFYLAATGGILPVRLAGDIAAGVEGRYRDRLDANLLERDSGSTWETIADPLMFKPWATWSPSVANITVGNGTMTAKYRQFGKTVDYRWKLKLGSTSGVGTNPRFTLPVAPHADYVVDEDRLGVAMLLDAATNLYDGIVWLISGSTVEIGALGAAGAHVIKATISATIPFTWGSGDTLQANGRYEAA